MKFSVIIPVYNAEKYLRQCLDSVLSQTESDWECVCVDDGATDGSGRILDEYAARDARFRVMHQKNVGVAVTRNVGLDAARGDWVTWLDADDLLSPQRLAVAGTMIDAERPDLVHLHFRDGTDADHPFDGYEPDYAYKVYDTPPDVFRMGWEQMNFRGMVWLWFARRELLQGMRFREGMRVKEDGVFTLGLVPKLKKVCKGMDRGLFYRQAPGSAMHYPRMAEDSIRFLQAFKDLWLQQRDYAASIGMLDLLKWRIQRGCGTDVIDWILKHPDSETAEMRRRVHTAYRAVADAGAFTSHFVQDKRYWPVFRLYERFGWRLPLQVVSGLYAAGGKMKRWLGRKQRKVGGEESCG